MIPKIIHFIFGLQPDFGGRPFSFIHYLAVYTAWKVNKPEKVLFHYAFEPNGEWWERAKQYVTLNKIEPPTEIFGNPLLHYAHRADIVRLRMLQTYGGVYLDLDILCINPFDPLFRNDFTMGLMRNRGLCNAVIISRPNAPFLAIWLDRYRDFDDSSYDNYSVVLPFLLAKQNPALCHVVHQDLFFYPTHNDPIHRYLFHSSMSSHVRLASLLSNLAKLTLHVFGVRKLKPKEFVLHALRGKDWHYRKLCKSYCVHLWETDWGNRYLRTFTPEYVLKGTSNLCLLLQKIIGTEELSSLSASWKSTLVHEKKLVSEDQSPGVQTSKHGFSPI